MRIKGSKSACLLILVGLLMVIPAPLCAVLPSGNLLYSGFLKVGEELEWEVSVLDWSGNESIYANTIIDSTPLAQGDKIKLTVTNDPNAFPIDLQAEGNWFNIALNNQEEKYNISDVQLGDHTWLYGDFFTSPSIQKIEEENTKLFESYYAHVKVSEEYNTTEYFADSGEQYSVQLRNVEFLSFNLTNTLFRETFYHLEYFNVTDNRYEGEEESLFKLYSVLYESIIDIERGTLFSYKCYIDYIYNYTSALKENEYSADHYHFLLENSDKTTGYSYDYDPINSALPYDTIFGINVNHIVIGMAVFTALFAVGGWVYRKKKEQGNAQVENQQITEFAKELKKVIESPQSQEKEKHASVSSSTENTATTFEY